MNNANFFECIPVSSLEKVRASVRPVLYENEGKALLNERYSFQIAYRTIQGGRRCVTCQVDSDLGDCLTLRHVDSVPCTYTQNEGSDDYYLTDKTEMIPDVLREQNECDIVCPYSFWKSLWVTVVGAPAGKHEIKFTFYDYEKRVMGVAKYTLTVLAAKLPESDIIYTNWLHYDAIADWHKLAPFSKEYYAVLGDYIDKAVAHGMTMLLTPIFTPALDTEVGAERRTAQLIDVFLTDGEYTFDFARLGEFIRFAKERGIRYFEIAHLFTQWGANATPKIMAMKEGKEEKIFGWETPSLSEEYKTFLSKFLPALREYLVELGVYGDCYFHISDEPNEEMLPTYRQCREVFKTYLPDGVTVDALSHYVFYKDGVVDLPFVATDCAQEFIDNGVKDYFVYFCTSQKNQFVSNRFIGMPSERTRIIGMQMYINGVRGLLQWGYNYYYTFLSKRPIDPYAVTDCHGVYQSGDAFIVYPTEGGALDSVRHELTSDGFEDYRALKLLESYEGRDKTVAFLKENGLEQNFTGYEKSALWLRDLRRKINDKIEGYCK